MNSTLITNVNTISNYLLVIIFINVFGCEKYIIIILIYSFFQKIVTLNFKISPECLILFVIFFSRKGENYFIYY